MKKIFYAHPDIILAVLALVFLGILISFYSWAINDVFTEVHRALTSSTGQAQDGFDLDGASKLGLDISSTTAALVPDVPQISSGTASTSLTSSSTQ